MSGASTRRRSSASCPPSPQPSAAPRGVAPNGGRWRRRRRRRGMAPTCCCSGVNAGCRSCPPAMPRLLTRPQAAARDSRRVARSGPRLRSIAKIQVARERTARWQAARGHRHVFCQLRVLACRRRSRGGCHAPTKSLPPPAGRRGFAAALGSAQRSGGTAGSRPASLSWVRGKPACCNAASNSCRCMPTSSDGCAPRRQPAAAALAATLPARATPAGEAEARLFAAPSAKWDTVGMHRAMTLLGCPQPGAGIWAQHGKASAPPPARRCHCRSVVCQKQRPLLPAHFTTIPQSHSPLATGREAPEGSTASGRRGHEAAGGGSKPRW